jgi:hypothetical protein
MGMGSMGSVAMLWACYGHAAYIPFTCVCVCVHMCVFSPLFHAFLTLYKLPICMDDPAGDGDCVGYASLRVCVFLAKHVFACKAWFVNVVFPVKNTCCVVSPHPAVLHASPLQDILSM